ncbi:hypothetical protein CAPTEDRAFT_207720 [Capitella teleta]|uniref:Uncharacterized protein n=1 Tax=Capitella teleta TaxID=283909 RepID=R7TCE4_CAPTE|nr:hypothetical protein CAPTEDRAFT_207720 [Capitella teleta]|eukprot:ELT91192.1 hypothetical protein CAPTEDRAFT_207720 [Capitella teleta]
MTRKRLQHLYIAKSVKHGNLRVWRRSVGPSNTEISVFGGECVKRTMGYPASTNQPETQITMQPQTQQGMQMTQAPMTQAPMMQAPMTQSPHAQIVVAEQRWSWCPLVTAVFGLLCFWPCGIVALLAATTSYTDHKVKDFIRSNNKRSIAYGFGITAIVFEISDMQKKGKKSNLQRGNMMREDTWAKAYGGDAFHLASAFCDLGTMLEVDCQFEKKVDLSISNVKIEKVCSK